MYRTKTPNYCLIHCNIFSCVIIHCNWKKNSCVNFEERIARIYVKKLKLFININASSVETERQKSSGVKRPASKESSSKDVDSSSGKLERRASFRRKFGALLKGSADLPAAINRGLQPIRRSLSFSKDLHRSHESSKPYRTSSMQWYNSLSSLAEDERVDVVDDYKSAGTFEEGVFDGRVQVTRTRSLLMEKNPVRISRYFRKRNHKPTLVKKWQRSGKFSWQLLSKDL